MGPPGPWRKGEEACQPLGTGQMMKCCHTALPCGLKIKEPTSRRAQVGRGGQGPPNHFPTPGFSDVTKAISQFSLLAWHLRSNRSID